jgi:phosphoribosyl 1,2-cyclic phosphate phosphodiesterase
VDVYMSEATAKRVKSAFDYCFEAPKDSGYPPILNAHQFEAGDETTISGPGGSITILAFAQEHGTITSLGFRVGNFAYSVDLSGLPETSLTAVSNLDVWILDALRPVPHPSHLSLPESLEWIERMAPKQAVLTNLHIDMDFETVDRATPENVSPTYDGMIIDISAGKILEQ